MTFFDNLCFIIINYGSFCVVNYYKYYYFSIIVSSAGVKTSALSSSDYYFLHRHRAIDYPIVFVMMMMELCLEMLTVFVHTIEHRS
jgi:hypothetical protein